jgi:transposase
MNIENNTVHKFVGIDISKKVFDVCFLSQNGHLEQHQLQQSPKGYQALMELIGQDAICVMEATSTYHLPLALWLHDHGVQVVIENPLKIKRFSQMHLQRCKSDKADARMIREYATTIVSKKINLWRPQAAKAM